MSDKAAGPDGSALSEGLGPLVPCPMCDSRSGYALKDGSTYRWWDVFCVNCGRTVDECPSDRRTQIGTELPDRWPAADAVWNAAGEHAESLRDVLRACQRHLACNACTSDIAALYARVRLALDGGPNAEATP